MIKKYIARRRHRGSFLIEMALVSWVLIFMLAGSFQMGLMLIRAIQAAELSRDANVLQVRGVDLSLSANQQLLLRTGPTLGINTAGSWVPNNTSSATGLVVLTKVYYVGPLECAIGITNWDGTTATCPNENNYVIYSRIYIGNSVTPLGTSVTGTPATTPGTGGLIGDNAVCTVTGNQVSSNFAGMEAILALTADQYTWVSEVWANSSAYNFFSFLQSPTIYMRNLS